MESVSSVKLIQDHHKMVNLANLIPVKTHKSSWLMASVNTVNYIQDLLAMVNLASPIYAIIIKYYLLVAYAKIVSLSPDRRLIVKAVFQILVASNQLYRQTVNVKTANPIQGHPRMAEAAFLTPVMMKK